MSQDSSSNPSPKDGLTIAMVAGEASGDMLGAPLMKALLARYPSTRFVGIGGPKMIGMGFNSLFAQENLAVRGYVEVLRSLPKLLRIRAKLGTELIRLKPDVFVGIDAPDFNLDLEKRLKKAGIPTVHYVSPSILAWRSERVQRFGESANKVLCLFPGEAECYAKVNVPALYVGHPLASQIPMHPDKEAMRRQLGLPLAAPIFTLMPGSRKSELDFMGELFLQTAQLLLRTFPDAQFLVPLDTRPTMDAFRTQCQRLYLEKLPLRILFGHAQMAIIASDVVLAKSGTSTLEVALAKRPMVISYKLSEWTYRLVKRKIRLPYVGLPNILCQELVVPELLQHDATPPKLAEAITQIYNDQAQQAQLKARFEQLHETLQLDTVTLAAQAILDTIASPLPKEG